MSLIVGLFPDLLPLGGVQRAGRHVAAVTAKFAADRNSECRFLSLNDPVGLHTVRVGATEFLVSGYARNKLQFVSAAVRAAGREPSLVFALHPFLAPILWAMKIRSRTFRSIVFAHGVEVWQPLGWSRGAALRGADLAVGPSAHTVNHLICEQRIPREKTERLAWGLDPEFEARVAAHINPELPPGFPLEGKIILSVGRWNASEQYKGADTLIVSLPNVLRTVPDAFLVLVGDGDDRPRLEQLARDNQVLGRTCFLRDLTSDQLFACYEACSVFALPSRGEGFGLVFLEAMAHGKPVIGGAHGGIPDVIDNGVTGLLVPHGNADLLAEAITSILRDPARANQMGARGKTRVEQTFSFERFDARLTQMLENVLSRES